MESGIDALRINPGNIGKRENVVKVVSMAKEKHIPIRIGINAGSLPEPVLEAYGGHPTAEGMVAAALELSLIHISEPTRQCCTSRMPSSA